jgi:hypothetical protein
MLPDWQKIASFAELDLVKWLKRRFCTEIVYSCQREAELFRLDVPEKAWRVDERLDKYADESLTQPKGIPMLWTIIVILVVLWLLGFIGHVGGSLIHLLLVVAVVVLIINLIQGRRGL